MKASSILLTLSILLLSSCKTNNQYTVETVYRQTTASGDSSMESKKEAITAATDSVAYLKAQAKFNEAQAKQSDDSKGVPVKFIVRNNKGNVVIKPGAY